MGKGNFVNINVIWGSFRALVMFPGRLVVRS